MWSRWWCGGGVGSLRQRVSFVFNGSHGSVGKVHPFDPFRGFGGEYCGGVGFVLKQMKRSVCSSTLLSSPAGVGGNSNSCGSGSDDNDNNNNNNGNGTEGSISFGDAKKFMRLVNVESLKMKLGMDGKEVIPYVELLQECKSMGVARSSEEASAFAKVLDEAGVILLFRDKVYLHPDKVCSISMYESIYLCLTCLCKRIILNFFIVGLT